MNTFKIVDIPPKMEKYYGKGKMLHPSLETIETLIKTIPLGSIATIDALAKRLATNFETEVTCPMRTGNAIKKIAERYSTNSIDFQLPFWRVIRTDKMLIKCKNYERWAAQIEDEGFKLIYTKSGAIKVEVDTSSVFTF